MANRWRGYGHPELYKMINDGPGAAASEPQTTYWKGLTDELSQVDQDLNTKLKNMGAAWEGEAAQRAESGLTPLAEWASDAELGSTVMKISSENQADYISDSRSSMPKPVPVTTPAPSGWQMAAAAVSAATLNPGPAIAVASQAADHEAQEAAQAEAEAKAVQTMETYESSSTANRDTLGTFVKPPDVVVSTDPPRGGTQTFVAGPESQSGPNAGVGAGSTTPSGAAIPSGGGGGAGAGTLTPIGGNAAPPAGGQIPVGGGVGAVPTGTTPAGLLPASGGQPPFSGPPLQPGPSNGLPVGPNNPGLGANQLLPGLSNTSNPNALANGGNGPLNAANRGPLVGGRPPINPGISPVGGNASDVARRAAPLRPGAVPGGGFGGGAAAQSGRGGLGAVPGASGAVRNGPGAAAAAGGRGAAANGVRGPVSPGGRGGVAPMGAGGRRADSEEDEERYAPDYLLETEDVFGDDRRVVPGVIGEFAAQE